MKKLLIYLFLPILLVSNKMFAMAAEQKDSSSPSPVHFLISAEQKDYTFFDLKFNQDEAEKNGINIESIQLYNPDNNLINLKKIVELNRFIYTAEYFLPFDLKLTYKKNNQLKSLELQNGINYEISISKGELLLKEIVV